MAEYGEKRLDDLHPDDIGMAPSAWTPSLSPSTGNSGSIIDLFNKNDVVDSSAQDQKEYKDALKGSLQAGLQGGQAGGGIGGTLSNAGASLGIAGLGATAGSSLAAAGPYGWGIMAGGMLLSAHEKKKQEEAAREQAKIQAEMTRRSNLIELARESARQDFRLV